VGGFMHENCVDYLHKHYHKGNLSVVAAGNIQQARLLELVDKYLVDLPEGQPNQRPAVSGQVALPQSFLQKETEQAHIVYGVPGFGLDDPRRYASRLLETVLAGPMSSRLFQEIREKRGLAYAVFATTMSFIGGGQLAIYCGTRPDNIGQVVSVLHTELNRLLADGISDEEFDRAREYTLGHLILNSESTQSKMTRLGGQAVGGLEVHSLDWTLDRYRALRKDDLMKVAQELFTQTPTVCIISPLSLEQMSKTVQQALEA
jgi:predicted Zn-dependent peptidase